MSGTQDPTLRQGVDRLMQNAQSLQGQFAQYYQDEANRPRLLSGVGQEGFLIQRNMNALMKTALKPGLNAPNSSYNTFTSTWNNGTGDLQRSFSLISEFWRLLSGARPELDRLMTAQPGPGPRPTGPSAEVQIVTLLQSQTNVLYDYFKKCVASHTPSGAARIKELSTLIRELLTDGRLSPGTVVKLTNSKQAWTEFMNSYKNGMGINNASLALLGYFVNYTMAACAAILK